MTILPPADNVVREFGLAGELPMAVAGGQSKTFRLGNLAVKHCDDVAQTEWLGGIMETVHEQGFRIARPVRAASGTFVVDGWSATQWIDGSTAIEGRWLEAIDALNAFHQALSHVPWSRVLQRMDNPYVQADAAIWSDEYRTRSVSEGNLSPGIHLGPTASRLRQLLRPVTLPSQLIQGDPSEGNLLFSPNHSPAIIDIAPYWHPPDYAIAMLIADGIAWSQAPLDLLAHVAPLPQMDQLLARAVLFRLYVGFLFRGGQSAAEHRARAYAPVIDAIEHWPQ